MQRLKRDGAIGWADWSWNILTGCTTGCSYCYARIIAKRFTTPAWREAIRPTDMIQGPFVATPGQVFPYGFAPTFYPHRLDEPLKVKKPSRIFVCSMGELFGDWVPHEWQEAVYETMRKATWHTFIILTKWPGQILLRLPWIESPVANIWHLTSVENQATWDKRVPEILKLREHGWPVLGVSVEPMLGPIEPHRIEELDWLILGGQSPPSSKQPEVAWLKGILNSPAVIHYPIRVFLKNNLRPLAGDNLRQEWPKDEVPE